MRRWVNQALVSAGSLAVLLCVLVAVNDRVRDQATRAFRASSSARGLTSVGDRLGDLAMVIVDAVRDQSLEHAPLMIFGLVAIVLVLAMLRT